MLARKYASYWLGGKQRIRVKIGVLTERETEVLCLLSIGHGTQDIADELHISYHTVRNHISNARRNLRAGSILAAVMTAQRYGLL